MTANSQLVPVKALQALIRRDSQRIEKKRYRSWMQALNDDLAKRAFDVLFSLLVLIFLSPLYIILALLISISSPGPIFTFNSVLAKITDALVA